MSNITNISVLAFDDHSAEMYDRLLRQSALAPEQKSPYVYSVCCVGKLETALEALPYVKVAIVDWFIDGDARHKNSAELVADCIRLNIPVYLSTSQENVNVEIRRQIEREIGHRLSDADHVEIHTTNRLEETKFDLDGFRGVFDSFVERHTTTSEYREKDYQTEKRV